MNQDIPRPVDKEYLEDMIARTIGDPRLRFSMSIDGKTMIRGADAGLLSPDHRDIRSLTAATDGIYEKHLMVERTLQAVDPNHDAVNEAILRTRQDPTFVQAVRTWMRLKYDHACTVLERTAP